MTEHKPEYVVLRRGDHGAVIHRTTCSHTRGAQCPTPWTPTDEREDDQACSRCLPDGIFANEAKRLLEPWAERICRLAVDMEEYVRALSDDDLALLDRASRWPNRTNCWWATHRAAAMVKDEMWAEKRRRENPSTRPAKPGTA